MFVASLLTMKEIGLKIQMKLYFTEWYFDVVGDTIIYFYSLKRNKYASGKISKSRFDKLK